MLGMLFASPSARRRSGSFGFAILSVSHAPTKTKATRPTNSEETTAMRISKRIPEIVGLVALVRNIERVTRPHEDQGNEAHDLRDSLADTHSSSLLRVRFAGQKLISMKPVNVRKLGYENPSNRNEYGSPDSPATSGSYPEYLLKVKRLRPITPIRRLLTPQPSF